MLQSVQEPSAGSLYPHSVHRHAPYCLKRTVVAMAGANGSAPTDPKLTALREAMSGANGGQGVHAYIVPSEDPHMVRPSKSSPESVEVVLNMPCWSRHVRAAMGRAGGDRMTHCLTVELWAQSEYAPVHQERRRYITNFTGSAGTALITEDKALLWTDGRYFLQASTCAC
jgi:hypothetical protein